MAVTYYNADGDAIAWRREADDSFLFNLDAQAIGWFPWDDEDAYSLDGEYLATIVEEDRLLRRYYQSYRGYPGTPGYVGYVERPDDVGRVGYLGHRVGFEDVPEHLLVHSPRDLQPQTEASYAGDGRAAGQALALMVGAAAVIGAVAALVHVNTVRKERRERDSLRSKSLAAPVPGWYPLDGQLRFWDGTRWTHHSAPFGAPLPFLAPVPRHSAPSGALVGIAWMFALATMGYLVPMAIAVSRGAANRVEVGLVNFFLGWTMIGWVVALVMALRRDAAQYAGR